MRVQFFVANGLNRATRNQVAWQCLLMIFALVLLARVVYVSLYAEDLPFWDQWDGEADALLRPWMEGTWQIGQLFSLHAEHRIAFTRLLTIAVFEANNHQWDNLVEADVNAGIYAAMIALLYAKLCLHEGSRFVRWVTLVVAVVLGMLPFDWENTLVGFQSQFYVMGIFAILMIAVIAYGKPSRWTLLLELMLGTCGLFTMASGLLAAAAVVVVVLLRTWCERLRPAFTVAMVACMGVLVLIGLTLIPSLPIHEGFKAKGLIEHLTALATTLMWPLQGTHWQLPFRCLGALLLWAPSCIALFQLLRRRSVGKSELFGLGLAVWVFLQAIAIAHSRGHDLTQVSSRYTDILAIGLLANVWFAARLSLAWWRPRDVPIGMKCAFWTVTALFALAVVSGLLRGSRVSMLSMRERHSYVDQQIRHVFDYISMGNERDLQQPYLLIPYPDEGRLRVMLDNPVIHSMLPVSIRTSLSLDASSPVEQGFGSAGFPKGFPETGTRKIIGSYKSQAPGTTLRYVGPVLHSSFPYLQFWLAGDHAGTQGLVLKLVSDDPGDRTTNELRLPQQQGMGWRHGYIATPGRSFHVVATDADPGKWFGFSEPVESGRLSMVAHWLQDMVRRAVPGYGAGSQPSD